jgi:hypothetical protein
MQFCSLGNISSHKNVQNQIEFIVWNFGFWVIIARLVTNCYCEKLFLSLFLFRVFLCCCCNKVIFVLMFGTQYYFFCSMFYAENWIVVRVKLTMRFLWRCNFAIWLCSQDVTVKMYMVFLYILVFAFCMFKTVKVSVTAERNWGDVNLLGRVGLWLMLRKMCCYYKHSEDMIRIVDVGLFWHNLWRLHCLCYIFLTWDMFALSLFVLR